VATIVGAAWYKDWLPWKRTPKRIEVASYAMPITKSNPASTGGKGASGTNAAVIQTVNGKTGVETAQSENHSTESANVGSTPTPPETTTTEAAVDSSAPGVAVAQPGDRGKPTTLTATAKRSPVHARAASRGDSAAGSPEEAVVVPPKLIRSAQALASLDDLRDFETGSVIIDAVVDETGNVFAMNVLSGPPSLRDPALRALKDYRYEPATRNGKPIPAHIKVKIQFHFE